MLKKTSVQKRNFSSHGIAEIPFFFCRRPLPFGGSHLKLPSGPATSTRLEVPRLQALEHRASSINKKGKIVMTIFWHLKLI